jgi:ribonuclease PH
MNVVMTGAGNFVEIQGTAEKVPFTRAQMSTLLDLSGKGVAELISLQRKALATPLPQ